MILDYSSYLTDIGSYGINSSQNNKNLFFDNWVNCLYCKTEIKTVHSKGLVDIKTIPETNWHKSETVKECPHCGWWQHSFHSYIQSADDIGFKDWQIDISNATLKSFAVNSNSVPINILRHYIEKNNDKIFKIHHKKMEELVASIFKEYYNCEVKVVGKSSDGGVDLIIINSDSPIMVQVKRRTIKNKTETVKEIRDLIGATLLASSRNCAFVTTADHFSSDANMAVKTALDKSIVDSFELFDYKRICDMLNLYKTTDNKRFETLIRLK